MALTLDHDPAFTGEYNGFVLVDAHVPEGNDTGVVSVAVFLVEDLAEGVEGVAVKYRVAEADFVETQLFQRLLCGVFRGQTDDEGGRDAAEIDSLLKGRLCHAMLVEVALSRIHHLQGNEHVIHLSNGAAAGMFVDIADDKVLEVVVAARQARY